jgi:hypothetical protein
MDLKKEYLIQALITASNNLRLTSEKIEIITILKERLLSADDVAELITNMKKVTQLSKFAIKLGEVNNYIWGNRVEFFNISEIFKQQSHNLVIELSNMLEVINPEILKGLMNGLQADTKVNEAQDINESKSGSVEAKTEYSAKSERDQIKESIIFEDMPESIKDFDFKSFEDEILDPIKKIDLFLGKLVDGNFPEEEIDKFIEVTNKNYHLSKENGFEILANMNLVFTESLKLIRQKRLIPNTSIVEKLRACLIVIVAVVRGKQVDITTYLNTAENFGKEILKLD